MRNKFASVIQQRFQWLMLLPAIVFLILFLVAALLLLLNQSFTAVDSMLDPLPGYSLSQYLLIFTSPDYLYTLANTLWVAVFTGVMTVVIAWPAALLLTRTTNKNLKTLLYIILLSPLLTSVVIRSFAWIVLLSQNGMVNSVLLKLGLTSQPLSLLWNMNAVIVAYVQVMLPFAVLPLVASINSVNGALKRASMSLGASDLYTFFHVIFPLTKPGMLTGFLIVFSLAAGSYITPLLIGGRLQPLLPLSIYQQALQIANIPLAAALSLTLLVATLLIAFIVGKYLKRWEKKVYG